MISANESTAGEALYVSDKGADMSPVRLCTKASCLDIRDSYGVVEGRDTLVPHKCWDSRTCG